MTILRFELKRNFKSFVVWTVSISLLLVWMASAYQSMSGSARSLEDLTAMFPESMKKAFGMTRLSLGTITGYFGIEMYIIILLGGAIYAVLLSSSLLSKEENDRTVEFLLARPVSRFQVVSQKLLAFMLYTALLTGATWASSYVAMTRSAPESTVGRPFWLLGLMTGLVLLALGGLGFLGSVFITRTRVVYSSALGAVVGLYALQLMADISDKARFLRYVTPFKWASPTDILTAGRVDPVYLSLTVGTLVLSVIGAFWAYCRKDIAV